MKTLGHQGIEPKTFQLWYLPGALSIQYSVKSFDHKVSFWKQTNCRTFFRLPKECQQTSFFHTDWISLLSFISYSHWNTLFNPILPLDGRKNGRLLNLLVILSVLNAVAHFLLKTFANAFHRSLFFSSAFSIHIPYAILHRKQRKRCQSLTLC